MILQIYILLIFLNITLLKFLLQCNEHQNVPVYWHFVTMKWVQSLYYLVLIRFNVLIEVLDYSHGSLGECEQSLELQEFDSNSFLCTIK